MCGIFGYNQASNPERTKRFFDELAHRGPDAQRVQEVGGWTLGHLRLSIIDTAAVSHQPFEKDGSWVVYNGEIYNYVELREKYLKPEELRTASDTEVLITLLNQKGPAILNELNGMFAFAWYEGSTGILHLVRDRYGVKPLYYTTNDDTFFFASEIKPLAHLRGEVTLTPSVLKNFFADTATDYDEQSGIRGVLQLNPGERLTVTRGGGVQRIRWYKNRDYTFDASVFTSKERTLSAFEDLLTDSLRLRHRSDVPICITLSGGLDSTTLYVLAKEKLASKIQPFIFSHPGSPTDESPRAVALAKRYGDVPTVIESRPATSINSLKEALRHLEYPIWNPSAIAYLDMYTAIKEHGYTVVIEGHGSDEQLGGYPYMIEAAWKQAFLRGRLREAYTLYRVWQDTQNPALNQSGGSTSPWRVATGILRGVSRGIIKAIIWPHKYRYLSFNALLRESFHYKILPIVLRAFDRLSMARSLETRCPFMDYRVVEFLRALPLEYKVNELGSKAILREILKKYGHEEIYKNRAKMGFATDIPAFLNLPANRQYLTEAVNAFDYPEFASEKRLALRRLEKPVLGWDDVADIWKVASITMTEKLYERN